MFSRRDRDDRFSKDEERLRLSSCHIVCAMESFVR